MLGDVNSKGLVVVVICVDKTLLADTDSLLAGLLGEIEDGVEEAIDPVFKLLSLATVGIIRELEIEDIAVPDTVGLTRLLDISFVETGNEIPFKVNAEENIDSLTELVSDVRILDSVVIDVPATKEPTEESVLTGMDERAVAVLGVEVGTNELNVVLLVATLPTEVESSAPDTPGLEEGELTNGLASLVAIVEIEDSIPGGVTCGEDMSSSEELVPTVTESSTGVTEIVLIAL